MLTVFLPGSVQLSAVFSIQMVLHTVGIMHAQIAMLSVPQLVPNISFARDVVGQSIWCPPMHTS